jgi:hypothetical protein
LLELQNVSLRIKKGLHNDSLNSNKDLHIVSQFYFKVSMKIFYYQIKGSKKDEYGGLGWSWPPIWQDIVKADCKKTVKETIEKEYNNKFPQRVLRKDLKTGMFLLNIQEIHEGDYTHTKLLKVNVCQQCGSKWTILEKYKINDGFYSQKYCSRECQDKNIGFEVIDNGSAVPVIYKITNKTTGMCYIGQTTQPFTLRWWQHFSKNNNSSAKFRKEIEKTKITDWIFEVIEITKKENLNTRESYFINKYDSIENGYNTMNIVKV